MGLMDVLTGGQNDEAQQALERARQAFASIQSPTAAQLTLPELQQYVQAGIMTPAEAKVMLQQGNAYNDINLNPETTENQQDVISKLKAVGDAKGMTPQMQAQLTQALDQVATNTRGTNAGILDQMAQRGIPTSLMAPAAMQEESGTNARNANLAATNAAGTAEQNAINAMMNEGNLASTMHGQQYSEASDKAAAENAMRQWNAGASNTASENNANRAQAANAYNTGVKQDVSNQNTGLSNQRTAYNANLPQQVFNNAITKAGGTASADKSEAGLHQDIGKQTAGMYSGLLGGAADLYGQTHMAAPEVAAAEGAIVPGEPIVDGDSRRNDFVHAKLSPGEVVLPRSVTTDPNAPDRARNFVNHLLKNRPITPAHPDDVHSVLEALSKRREGPTLIGSERG